MGVSLSHFGGFTRVIHFLSIACPEIEADSYLLRTLLKRVFKIDVRLIVPSFTFHLVSFSFMPYNFDALHIGSPTNKTAQNLVALKLKLRDISAHLPADCSQDDQNHLG